MPALQLIMFVRNQGPLQLPSERQLTKARGRPDIVVTDVMNRHDDDDDDDDEGHVLCIAHAFSPESGTA